MRPSPNADGWTNGSSQPRTRNGWRRARRVALALAALGFAAVPLVVMTARATNHVLVMTEVAAGVNGNAAAQFIEIKIDPGQNLWGPQGGPGSPSQAMLVFFDQNNVQTTEFRFPANAPNAPNGFVLIGTAAFRDVASMPDPDILLPSAFVRPGSGRVCFRNTPENPGLAIDECVGYGGVGPSPVAAQLPTTGSVRRKEDPTAPFGFQDTDDNAADWFVTNNPNPIQADDDPPTAAEIAEGRRLFTEETFGGNGRTCATCHVLTLNGGMPPSNVHDRFGELDDTFDPLFIAEVKMNLNTLTIDRDVTFPDGAILTGTSATGQPAKAKVLTRKNPANMRVLLVYGGILPQFATNGTITDGVSSAQVVSIATGNLNELEHPTRMRISLHPDFPDGRALILENIDGFNVAEVFRKSPHLQNLKNTGPFGFSSNIMDLGDFAEGAVVQHFPRTLARRAAGDPGVTEPDFRRPTPEERRLIKIFMLSLDSVPDDPTPGADNTDKFNLGHFARTVSQRNGQTGFQNGCNNCHSNAVLGSTERINTGVANQSINFTPDEPLPTEPAGGSNTREFSTPGLFNVKHNGPFFHDNSEATLAGAVAFYNSSQFANSPGGTRASFDLGPQEITDLTNFLKSLSVRRYVVESGGVNVTRNATRVDFGAVGVVGGQGRKTLTVRNTSTTASIRFANPACRVTGFSGEPAPEFPQADCTQLNGANLAPGASVSITAFFDPADELDFKFALLEILTDTVTDPSNDEPTGVELVGRSFDGVEERFDADFTAPPLPWRVQRGGSWTASGGQFRLASCTGSGCVQPLGNILTHDFVLPESYSLTVGGIAAETTSTVNDFVVIFNFINLNNYYYASFNETDGTSTSDDTATNGIFRVVNGTRTQIRDFGPTTSPGGPTAPLHLVRIEKMRGTIRVFRDGTLMGVVTDSSFTGGNAGLGSFNDSARFDNFVIHKHELSEDNTLTHTRFQRVIGGTFTVTGGKLQLTNPDTGVQLPNSNIATHITNVGVQDFELFVDGNAPASSSTFDDFSIFFNFVDTDNHYFVNISEGDDSAANGLFKVEGGVRTQIRGFGSNTTPPGTARRIRVERISGRIRVFRENEQLGTDIVDITFPFGKIGVGSRNNAATFDHVFVERR